MKVLAFRPKANTERDEFEYWREREQFLMSELRRIIDEMVQCVDDEFPASIDHKANLEGVRSNLLSLREAVSPGSKTRIGQEWIDRVGQLENSLDQWKSEGSLRRFKRLLGAFKGGAA